MSMGEVIKWRREAKERPLPVLGVREQRAFDLCADALDKLSEAQQARVMAHLNELTAPCSEDLTGVWWSLPSAR
jgi:hypothetical protein